MKIVFTIQHPAHVHFFQDAITELSKRRDPKADVQNLFSNPRRVSFQFLDDFNSSIFFLREIWIQIRREIYSSNFMISEQDMIPFGEIIEYTKDNKYIYILEFFKNLVLERFSSNFRVPFCKVTVHGNEKIQIDKNMNYIRYDVIFEWIHPYCITNYDQCICNHHCETSPSQDKYLRNVQPVRNKDYLVIGTETFVTENRTVSCLTGGIPVEVLKKMDNLNGYS